MKRSIIESKKKEEALNRLNSRSIVEILESDDEEIEFIKKEDSEDEFVRVREPSPICVADLKKKQAETIVLDDDDSDCEVVERNEESVIEIPESDHNSDSENEEQSGENSRSSFSSSNSTSTKRTTRKSPSPVVFEPEKPKYEIIF